MKPKGYSKGRVERWGSKGRKRSGDKIKNSDTHISSELILDESGVGVGEHQHEEDEDEHTHSLV